jgi:hypothetical protein
MKYLNKISIKLLYKDERIKRNTRKYAINNY